MMRLALAATAAVLAGPVQAQDDAPICGGISQVGAWLGGAPDASDPAVGGPLDAEGMVPIAGHFVRMFTLTEPGDVRVEAAAIEEGDPFLVVYDAAGTEVAEDDDSGGNFAARAETSLGPGRYCVAVRSYGGGLTQVALRVGLQSQAALTDGAETAPAAPAPSGGVGAACGADDVARIGDDLIADTLGGDGVALGGTAAAAPGRAFTLAEALPLTVTATSEDGDPLIRLLDAEGQQLAENDDSDGLDSRIDLADALPAGAYCVEVEDLNQSESEVVVALSVYDSAAERRAQLDRAEFAPGPDDAVTVDALGAVETSLVHDVSATGAARWLRFSMPEGGLLVTEAIAGTNVDPVVTLFDRVGRRVGENDDGPTGLDSFLAARLLPGEYLLAVRLVDESDSGPVRILLERFVPAQ